MIRFAAPRENEKTALMRNLTLFQHGTQALVPTTEKYFFVLGSLVAGDVLLDLGKTALAPRVTNSENLRALCASRLSGIPITEKS